MNIKYAPPILFVVSMIALLFGGMMFMLPQGSLTGAVLLFGLVTLLTLFGAISLTAVMNRLEKRKNDTLFDKAKHDDGMRFVVGEDGELVEIYEDEPIQLHRKG